MQKLPVEQKLLQEICEQISNEISAIVSVFVRRGEIVASSKPSRIGDLHKGAAKIIEGNADFFEVTADEAAKSQTMLEGITLPVEFDGKRVFCVSVAAPLKVARQYGRIAQYWVASHLKAAQAEETYRKDLELSEQRFRNVAESAGDWIWEMDSNLRFSYLSPRFYEIFPVSPEQIIGKTRDEYAGRELDEPHWQQHYATLAAHQSFREFEYSTQLADGSVRHLKISGKPVYNADGEFAGYRGTGSDITQQVEVKRALELSQQRFRDVAESAGDWVWEMDSNLRFSYLSPRFYEIFPVSPEQIIGKTRDEYAGRELDEPHWQQHYATLAAHQSFREFEYSTQLADGSVRHLKISGKPVYNADDEFAGYRGTGSDITQQVEVKRELKQTEQRLADAIETISEGFSLYDAQDRLVIFNNKYKSLLYPDIDVEFTRGMTFEAILRRAAECGYIQDTQYGFEEWVQMRLARHREPGEPHVHQRRDGRWIMVSERKTKDGGTVAVYSDITEIKKREEELAEKSRSLEILSSQLAKYLSPQVYDSIFTGKQEVKVASHRKKLTVFFSDIAGFTEAADRMESEELTKLLNHYLTEMSQIAIEHGATIDKYVGDAIVIFFGDPETLGVKEDAQACVRMAIAMRQRMRELQEVWRDSGIEKPLQCRIGINTGFCTVGNFGSEDRMDYTIIGNGVNLASRLESAATPGQILISYETYALVRDLVSCESQGEIKVKGISAPVETFQVIDTFENLDRERGLIFEDQPHFKLRIDIDEMSVAERNQTMKSLNHALGKLGAKKKRKPSTRGAKFKNKARRGA